MKVPARFLVTIGFPFAAVAMVMLWRIPMVCSAIAARSFTTASAQVTLGFAHAASPSEPAPTPPIAALLNGSPPDATPPLRTPSHLLQLLAQYDAAPVDQRLALAAAVDLAAGQRYATAARLFWYTDLEQAKSAASATGKPILSLRMLGRLDDELSCANSRFFRVVLYPNPTVRDFLERNFILHWSSERPVPIVTIDLGNGRRIIRPTAGNSVHYVLDVQGRPVDAIPGLYAPREFVATLTHALKLEQQLRALDDAARQKALVTFHRNADRTLSKRWRKQRFITRIVDGDGAGWAPTLRWQNLDTVRKAITESPIMYQIGLGLDPALLQAPRKHWRTIGQALFGYFASYPAEDEVGHRGMQLGAAMSSVADVLSPPSIQLFRQMQSRIVANMKVPPPSLQRSTGSAAGANLIYPEASMATGYRVQPVDPQDVALAEFAGDVVADTALNEFSLHKRIHALWAAHGNTALTFIELNSLIYRDIFATPSDDPWLGIVQPLTFAALPNDGIEISNRVD